MTRREKILAILTDKITAIKEPLGYQALLDIAKAATDEVVALNKTREEVIHCVGPNGSHRLIVDGKSSKWSQQNELCRNGDFIASTDFFFGQLPQVAMLHELDSTQFYCTSQQNLAMTDIPYPKTLPESKQE